MNKYVILIVTVLVWVLFFGTLIAQPSIAKMKEKIIAEKAVGKEKVTDISLSKKYSNQGAVSFHKDSLLLKADVEKWTKEKLQLREKIDELIQENASETILDEIQVHKYKQKFRGVPVEHGRIIAVGKEESIASMLMEFYPIKEDMVVKPTLSEAEALILAIKYFGEAEENGILPQSKAGKKSNLVMVEDVVGEKGEMCLAYKFTINSKASLRASEIYINATSGVVVFSNSLNFHNNTPGKADTKFSGRRDILSSYDSDLGKYILLESGRAGNTQIYTVNCKSTTSKKEEFTDDNNDWTSNEIGNDNVALDAHWGIEMAIDYFSNRFGRKGFDNNGTPVINYVHYLDPQNPNPLNAFFTIADGKGYIAYGDGSIENNFQSLTSLDICAHEFAHGICRSTSNLIYARESGALNEGFSDIWAACVENYILKLFPDRAFTKDIWKIGEEVSWPVGLGIRNMRNPDTAALNIFGYGDKRQPTTYGDKNHFWRDPSQFACPDNTKFDNCWVHINSGVLNKWFYLITSGGSGTNSKQYNYNVSGLGFDKTESLIYLTEAILTRNSGFEAAKFASLISAKLLSFSDDDISIIKHAWNAVGVMSDTLFSMANTPAFTTSNFTSIGVGKHGYIWAGTSNQGLYQYNGIKWTKATYNNFLTNVNISNIKTDRDGGIWIAQYGRNGLQATEGGIVYYPDTLLNSARLYSTSSTTTTGIPTRNVRALFVNNFLTDVDYPKYRVWSAHLNYLNENTLTVKGGIGKGTNFDLFESTQFKTITSGIDLSAAALGNCQTIAGNENEVWTFVTSNVDTKNQIICHNTNTENFIRAFDETNTILPPSFFARAIYYDSKYKQWWVGLQVGGIFVYDVVLNTWTRANTTFFPSTGTFINSHAITGDKDGNIYIGSNVGLFSYNGAGTSPDIATFNLFNTAHGLPSNNVRAICVDSVKGRLLIATDNGILFKHFLSPEKAPKIIASLKPGLWQDPTVWSNNSVPGENDDVDISHAVIVNAAASCKSLTLKSPGTITVSPGIHFTIVKP